MFENVSDERYLEIKKTAHKYLSEKPSLTNDKIVKNKMVSDIGRINKENYNKEEMVLLKMNILINNDSLFLTLYADNKITELAQSYCVKDICIIYKNAELKRFSHLVNNKNKSKEKVYSLKK